jgi:hypothetical protein
LELSSILILFFLPNFPPLPLSSKIVNMHHDLTALPASSFFPHECFIQQIFCILNATLVSTSWRTQTYTPKKTEFYLAMGRTENQPDSLEFPRLRNRRHQVPL